MKKTMLTRILSTVSSAILLSAIAASALTASAANTPNSGTAINGDSAVITAFDGTAQQTFDIKKDIILYNVDGSTIYEPNITYTYTAAGANVSGETKITGLTTDDNDGDATVTVSVHSGVPGVVTIKGNTDSSYSGTAHVQFGKNDSANNTTMKETDTLNQTNADAHKAVKTLSVQIDATKFTGANVVPGVYRYVITDTTTDDALTAAGIKRDNDYDEVRYLDVYTKYNENKDGLVVYGYVLLKGSSGADTSLEYQSGTTETVKVTGYDTDSETGSNGDYDTTEPNSDQYHTYNVTVNKVVDGDLGDKNHAFPFQIALTNDNKVTSLDDFYYKKSSDTDTTHANLNDSGALTLGGLTLKDGESITITGLPVKTSVVVTETNDTLDAYTVKAKDSTNADLYAASTVTHNGNAATTSKELVNKENYTITFTNTLKEISVTGVAFTVAPFALILFAGVILYAVYAKNRKKNSEDVI